MALLLLLLVSVLLAASSHGATTKLRILYHPNNTALSPVDEDWTITYEYTVPPDKPGAEWDPTEGVFFIWGDTDFDSYGPRSPSTQMHDYIFNQIVPQLVIGDTLAAGNASTNYNPGMKTHQLQLRLGAYYTIAVLSNLACTPQVGSHSRTGKYKHNTSGRSGAAQANRKTLTLSTSEQDRLTRRESVIQAITKSVHCVGP